MTFAMVIILCGAVVSFALLPTGVESKRGQVHGMSDTESFSSYTRVRLSGALLFANWDGFRSPNLDLISFFKMDVDEIIRNADTVFQRSEIRGYINVHLLEDGSRRETFTIFERTDYDYIAFAEPFFFTLQFKINLNASNRTIEIECNLEEAKQGVLCTGSKPYSPALSNKTGTDLNLNRPTGNDTQGNEAVATGDIDPEAIATALNSLGYYKLYKPSSASNLAETISIILEMKAEWDKDMTYFILHLLPNYMREVGGIFLESLTLEQIADDTKEEGYYRKVNDYWYLLDEISGGAEEPYGQLYILPQASLLSTSHIKGIPVNFQLPIIKGPAFPLFDMTRAQRDSNDYQEKEHTEHNIEIYYKNEFLHTFVVFVNMWEVDGNSADDCFAKGNALGFDIVTISKGGPSPLLSSCQPTGGMGLVMSQHYDPVPDDGSQQELSGTFVFKYTSNDPGHYSEPYGYFDVIVDGIKRTVWKDNTEIPLGSSYTKTFGLHFPTMNSLKIDGFVKELDDFSGDDEIGTFDNVTINLSDISTSKRTYRYNGDDGYVEITLYHPPTDDPSAFAEYELIGTFEYWGYNGNEGEIEPIGEFSVEIKKRTINTHFEVWKGDITTYGYAVIALDNYETFRLPFLIRFRDYPGFHTWDSTNIVLHGNITDFHGSANDNIASFEGFGIKPADLYDTNKVFPFPGIDGNATISMVLHLVGNVDVDMMEKAKLAQPVHTEL